MEGKIGKSRERPSRRAGQCFNAMDDAVSMLRRYYRAMNGWILEARKNLY